MHYRIGDKMEIEELKNRMENLNCEIVNIKSDQDEFLFLTTNDNDNIFVNDSDIYFIIKNEANQEILKEFVKEKFEMLKNSIEKIMNDKKFKENEVVFIPYDEMKEIGKISTVLKEIRTLYRVHVKGYNKGIAVSKKIEKPVNKE